MRVFCLIRNRWQFIAKNYSIRSLVLLAPLFLVYETGQFVIVVRKGWTKEWFRAVGWMFGHAGEVLAKRREVQSRRKRPDRDLLYGGAIPFREELTTSPVERKLRHAFDVLASNYWSVVGGLV